MHSLKACRATRDFVSGGTPLGIVRQGPNEELSNRIVPWNVSSCVVLVYMNKLDLILGTSILAILAVIIINGIAWSFV